jgi:hypothetical protein
MIKLELSIEECNMILRVLGKHPFEEVVSVINKIKQQASHKWSPWKLRRLQKLQQHRFDFTLGPLSTKCFKADVTIRHRWIP